MAGSVRAPVVFVISSLNELAVVARKCLPAANITNITPVLPGEISDQDETNVLQSAEVLFADKPFISKYIYRAEKLKWAHSTSAGVDTIMCHIDIEKPPRVLLSQGGTAFTDLMAEYVLGYILAKEKNMFGMYEDQKNKVWKPEEYKNPRLLSNLRLGILGAGQIGTRIGTFCKAVGMEVWGMTREEKNNPDLPLDVYKTTKDLPDILENCDYICSVLPTTPDTKDLLSGDILKHCLEKKSVFINVGRGTVINEDSLVTALRNEWIGGAVLDVFNTEPLSVDSPLWSFPNVIITPHISGPCQTQLVVQTFVKNYKRFVGNEKLGGLVNWSGGY
ncbi:glyoxylate/hydroxypyruvate reductase A-like [Mytilus edulis]|uniref:glyoxylate/hydroxypyruvate reductase A-like n=1 Tax=Mytilus edulis TaxID=6550 RepID=UPI0039EE9F59